MRSLVDRVLRLKGEQDALAGDIKEVYAEAKASGFDKTIMGQLVAFLRKREKDPHKVEENGAIFDVYLHAYDSGTNVALAHAHEAELPPHDEDGVIIEEPNSSGCQDAVGAGHSSLPKGTEPRGAAPTIINEVPANGPATAPAPGAGGVSSTATGDAGDDHGRDSPLAQLGASPINSNPVAGATEQGLGTEHKPEPGPDSSTSDPGPPQASEGRLTKPETSDPEGSEAASAGFLIAGKSLEPSHQFPCEANGWAGLEPPPQFDRREKAA